MPDDYEGKVVCTLVKKPQLDSVKQAVLYIHGYNDYFFQKQLGDSVNAHGYNFYAMDIQHGLFYAIQLRFLDQCANYLPLIIIRHLEGTA